MEMLSGSLESEKKCNNLVCCGRVGIGGYGRYQDLKVGRSGKGYVKGLLGAHTEGGWAGSLLLSLFDRVGRRGDGIRSARWWSQEPGLSIESVRRGARG